MNDSDRKLIIEARPLVIADTSPRFVVIAITPRLPVIVMDMHNAILAKGATSMRREWPAEWQDNNQHHITFTEMEVDRDMVVAFHAITRRYDHMETPLISIETLRRCVEGSEREVFVGFPTPGNHDDTRAVREDYLDDLEWKKSHQANAA